MSGSFVTLGTEAQQAPLSMGFSRQEYWSGVPLPSLRPSLRIASYQLNNLFNTLKGDPDLNSPHSLSQEAWEELCLVQNKLQKQFLTHIKLDLPLELFILSFPHSPTGLLAWQKHPVEWIYTHFREIKSFTSYLDLIALIIINERNRNKTLIGSDPHKIVIPINKISIWECFTNFYWFPKRFFEIFWKIFISLSIW